MGVSHNQVEENAEEYVRQLEDMQLELEETRWKCQEACRESEWVKDQLSSMESLQEKQDLLIAEVGVVSFGVVSALHINGVK